MRWHLKLYRVGKQQSLRARVKKRMSARQSSTRGFSHIIALRLASTRGVYGHCPPAVCLCFFELTAFGLRWGKHPCVRAAHTAEMFWKAMTGYVDKGSIGQIEEHTKITHLDTVGKWPDYTAAVLCAEILRDINVSQWNAEKTAGLPHWMELACLFPH